MFIYNKNIYFDSKKVLIPINLSSFHQNDIVNNKMFTFREGQKNHILQTCP